MGRKRNPPLVIGTRYAKLVVVENLPLINGRRSEARFLCDCGNEVVKDCSYVATGRIQSCGCIYRFRTYINEHPKLYQTLADMIKRCHNSAHQDYYDYGQRGITVCDAWRNDPNAFVEWSIAHGYKPHLTIDRIDNDGDYSPENCRWVTLSQNLRNKRNTRMLTAFGETKPMADWADDPRCVVSYDVLHKRIWYGWQHERAITQPHRYNR